MKAIVEQFGMRAFTILALTCLATSAAAGDYEAGLTYRSISGDYAHKDSAISSDTVRVVLTGSWYYSGLSETNGPRSRSAFLDRASDVRLAYSYADNSVLHVLTGRPVAVVVKGVSNPQILDARLRHVWKTSGWYGLSGFTKGHVDTHFVASVGTTVSWVEPGFNAYTVGIGKYLGQATAFDLSVISSGSDGFDVTTYALSFHHMGSLGDKWHYAADLSAEASEGDYTDQIFSIGLSIFPTTEFEFGINFRGDGWSILDPDLYGDYTPRHGNQDTWGGFISWFIREQVEVNASYRNADWHVVEDGSTLLSDIDQFTIGVNVRF